MDSVELKLSLIQIWAVILTMGCRERTRGALAIPGERPAGVFTAGVAQAYMNIYNTMVGRNVIILGSGDIGMIMARRMTLEGAQVKAVFEIQPYPSGLPRNIEQCLNDYDIPLYLSHTVTEIHGDRRLKGVTVSKVDENLKDVYKRQQFALDIAADKIAAITIPARTGGRTPVAVTVKIPSVTPGNRVTEAAPTVEQSSPTTVSYTHLSSVIYMKQRFYIDHCS